MRDISYCVQENCSRKLTCQRRLSSKIKKQLNGEAVSLICPDGETCQNFWPVEYSERVMCGVTEFVQGVVCPRKDKCKRAKYDPMTTYMWLTNGTWTKKDIETCPYFIGEEDE